jgi:gliding motility-associated-like protein
VEVLSDQVTDPEWTPADGLSCTKCLNPTVTVIGMPGSSITYQFSGMILDCPVGASLTIQIPPMQIIDITGDNVVCAGDMVQLTVTNPQDLSGFHWTTLGDGSFSCVDCINPIVTVNSDAGLTVFVSAFTSNNNFCGAIGSFTMLPGQQFNETGPLVQACLGGTAVASTGNPNNTDIQWDVISGDLNLSCNACENPIVTVNSQGLLRYFAESSDPNICKVIGSVSVSTFPEDASNLLISPDPATNIGQGEDVMASLNVAPPPASVMWTVNGASIATTTTTIGFNASEEINFVEAKFINSKGCEQTDTISFHTIPPYYQIPNAFTPDNNDEINDKFRIIIKGNIEVDEFLVFNRWGQLVFNGEDDPDGWDGIFKGEPAASDTYVYTAKLRFPDGETKIAKGDVILLR